MKDLFNSINPKRAISPVAAVDNTAIVGQIIDRQGFDSVTYLLATGNLPDIDATYTVLLEEGDAANMSDAAAVADSDLLGTEVLASFTFAADHKCFKLGYKGIKRYTRLTLTPANLAAGAELVCVIAVMGHPEQAPTINPPV